MFVNPEHNQKVAKCSGLTVFRADIQVPGREPYVRVGTLASVERSPEFTSAHLFNRAKINPEGGPAMNWDQIEGKWKQFKGEFKQQWGKLTDDELDRAAGKRDELEGLIQERYGIAREEAKKQVDDWMSRH